jgi:hypothetical protein
MLLASAFDAEDIALDIAWRERFGQPLPLRGCGDLAWRLLDAALGAPASPHEQESFASVSYQGLAEPL